MKKLLATLFTIGLSSYQPAFADNRGLELKHCEMYGTIAEEVMLQRQAGASKDKLLAITKGKKDDVSVVVREIINSAFEDPIFTTVNEKLLASEMFSSFIYETCIKAKGLDKVVEKGSNKGNTVYL